MSSEASRLEIERLEVSEKPTHLKINELINVPVYFQVQFSEKLNQQQTRYNIELAALREQLHEAEAHKDMLQRELQQVREKLDSTRLESLNDSEETIAELRKRHDRELKIVMDDNRKLCADLEMLSETNRRMQAERMQMECDYEELRYEDHKMFYCYELWVLKII